MVVELDLILELLKLLPFFWWVLEKAYFFWCNCGLNAEMLSKNSARRVVKLLAGVNWKIWVFNLFNALFFLASLILFLVALTSGYYYLLPTLLPSTQQLHSYNTTTTSISAVSSRKNASFVNKCDLFDGNWLYDDRYPLYNASECPFAERGFNCLANGRKDKDYLAYRWKPKTCEIPGFDAGKMLNLLKGKRVVFVGDSLSRTQWESMVCMLMTGVEDKRSVYEINGSKITRQIRHLGVKFSGYDLKVEFYRSVFLVRPGVRPKRAPRRVKVVLKLDMMDDISDEWIDSDILVFNSGHWWTPTKLFDMGWYFQVKGKMKLGMSITGGFKIALETWKSWVEHKIDPNRTRVFFRTFESTHWSSGSRLNCKVTTQPMTEPNGRDKSVYSDMVMDVVKNLSIPANVLHVTPLGALRSDAHVGTFSYDVSVPDCSHWCLPGVPDVWNEMLFSLLFSRDHDYLL